MPTVFGPFQSSTQCFSEFSHCCFICFVFVYFSLEVCFIFFYVYSYAVSDITCW